MEDDLHGGGEGGGGGVLGGSGSITNGRGVMMTNLTYVLVSEGGGSEE